MGALTKADLAEMLFDDLGLNKREAKKSLKCFTVKSAQPLKTMIRSKFLDLETLSCVTKVVVLEETPRPVKKYLFLRDVS